MPNLGHSCIYEDQKPYKHESSTKGFMTNFPSHLGNKKRKIDKQRKTSLNKITLFSFSLLLFSTPFFLLLFYPPRRPTFTSLDSQRNKPTLSLFSLFFFCYVRKANLFHLILAATYSQSCNVQSMVAYLWKRGAE